MPASCGRELADKTSSMSQDDVLSLLNRTLDNSRASVELTKAMLGHIYIGTIGMEGAFEAMGAGTVDVNWAKEHHNLWLEEVRAGGQPRLAQQQPAATPGE